MITILECLVCGDRIKVKENDHKRKMCFECENGIYAPIGEEK